MKRSKLEKVQVTWNDGTVTAGELYTPFMGETGLLVGLASYKIVPGAGEVLGRGQGRRGGGRKPVIGHYKRVPV